MSTPFQVVSPFQPAGDQPQAIEKLVGGFRDRQNRQVLLGATGTGKTFTAANVIAPGAPSDDKPKGTGPRKGQPVQPAKLLYRLVDIQYERHHTAFERGRFRVRGDVVEVWPASEEFGLRIELFGDEVDALAFINPLTGETIKPVDEMYIYPAKHFVTPEDR